MAETDLVRSAAGPTPQPDVSAVAPTGPSGSVQGWPQPLRVLDEDGRVVAAEVLPDSLSAADLARLYELMLVTRAVDDQAVALQRQGELGTYSPCRGQEAAQVGAAAALTATDWVFPTYRELGMAVARDLDPVALLVRSRGSWLSGHDPAAHRFALPTVPIGTQLPHAVGFALGAVRDRSDLVVLACLGDGATSAGDTHEAMNIAGVMRLPCVFLLQNNAYAISMPARRQSGAPSLAHRSLCYGIAGVRVDGNDVLACYGTVAAAVERARAGRGPTLVEALTYRMGPHTTADDPRRYRSDDEVDLWHRRDPIPRLGGHLRRRGLLTDADAAAAHARAQQRALEVRRAVLRLEPAHPLELFEHVTGDLPPHLARQRDELQARLLPPGGS